MIGTPGGAADSTRRGGVAESLATDTVDTSRGRRLTRRARVYLESLPWVPALPVPEVAEALERAGVPVFDAWLRFHETYAGRVIDFGAGDCAVLGLAHPASGYRPARTVAARRTAAGRWTVECADAHVAHRFHMDQGGLFAAGPAATFDVFLERTAIWDEFCDDVVARTGLPPVVRFDVRDEALLRRITEGTTVLPESVDRYFSYHMGDGMLAIRDRRHRRWRQVILERASLRD